MVTKIALILLLVGLPVAAQDKWTTGDSLFGYPLCPIIKQDTTRNYIKEIKQKCDTVYEAIGGHDCTLCPKCGTPPITFWANITCIDDTVWAEKIQVWLTPVQLEYFMEMIKEREQWELDVEVGRWSPIKKKLKE